MNALDRCLEILETLGSSMRYWGRYIDEFAECFCSLSNDERCILRELTPNEDKFALMNQLLGQVSRNYSKSSLEEKRKLLNLCFILIAFENFEFDYRENTLSLDTFFKNTNISKDLRSEEWDKVKALMPSKALGYLKGYF
jgi:hypothetical protein